MKYSFEIHFNAYARVSPALQDIKALYVSGICICAKNKKVGSTYNSKYIKSRRGSFMRVAGSHQYPVLFPNDLKVIICIKNFPHYPVLDKVHPNPLHEGYDEKYIWDHISIKNINSHEN